MFVYMLRCADDTLYVGHASDIAQREQIHNAGHGARYTAARRPVRLVYCERSDSVQDAVRREQQLKGWTAAKKEALIAGDLAKLKPLGKRQRH